MKMPIGGGFRMSKPSVPSPPPVPMSPSSLQLDKSTEMSLKLSLMALEPVSGTVPPSGWTTSSAMTSTQAPEVKESLPGSPLGTSAKSSTEVSTVASREPATFAMLPENVLERIFFELPLKCDQRTLTLLNRKTYSLLVKDLYRTVIVDISSYPQCLAALIEMLNFRNPGRQHIRGVVFDQTNLFDKLRPPSGYEQLAYNFLANLEDGQLEYFGWPADYSLNPSYSLSLWQDHPDLENIELYENSCGSPVEVKNALSQMKNVVSLRVSPDSEAGFKNVDKILSNIKTIVYLHVDLRTFCPPPSKDASLIPQKLFSTAISTSLKMNQDAHWKLSLTHLALWNVDLSPSSCAMWVRVLNLAPLQSIELSHCPHAENFLAAMASDTQDPELQSLTINHQVPSADAGHELCDALEQYLEKKSPLSKLVLRIKDLPRVPNWMHVGFHGLQFETLHLDLKGSEPYSGNDMENILGCTSDKLRQIGFVASYGTNIATIFNTCNPVTLYLLGASQTAEEVFNYAERGYHARMNPDNSPFRLRVVALSAGDKVECFMRVTTEFLRKKRQVVVSVDLRELTKCGEEVEILIGEPIAFGPGGRN